MVALCIAIFCSGDFQLKLKEKHGGGMLSAKSYLVSKM